MILNDREIKDLVATGQMIEPFAAQKVRDGGISYGLQSFGYDIRLSNEFKRLRSGLAATDVIDPLSFEEGLFDAVKAEDYIIIPPNSFALGRSVEYIRMPRTVTGIVLGKSSYARCGIVTNFTPLEAGWEGHFTIEISNTTPQPARVYCRMGIGQILFLQGNAPMLDYAQTGGTYQGQTGVTGPRAGW